MESLIFWVSSENSSLVAICDDKPMRVYAPCSLVARLSSLETLGYALGIRS
jgi:hypothetical protein